MLVLGLSMYLCGMCEREGEKKNQVWAVFYGGLEDAKNCMWLRHLADVTEKISSHGLFLNLGVFYARVAPSFIPAY